MKRLSVLFAALLLTTALPAVAQAQACPKGDGLAARQNGLGTMRLVLVPRTAFFIGIPSGFGVLCYFPAGRSVAGM